MSISLSWQSNYKTLNRFNRYPYSDIVSKVFKYKKKNHIALDLGCGGGNHSEFLSKEFKNVYAIDESAEAIRLTKKRIKNKKNAFVCKFKEIPKKFDNYFGMIIDRASLTHNKISEIEETIPIIKKKLKKNGILISTFWSHNCTDIKFGKKIKDEKFSFEKFKKGNFMHSPITTF